MSDIKTPPKKLVDLNPKWITVHSTGEVYGIGYDCPCAAPDCQIGGRATVPTKRNFTGAPSSADSQTRGWDVVAGDSFENIVLSPSIHHVGHWHGFLGGSDCKQPGVLVSC